MIPSSEPDNDADILVTLLHLSEMALFCVENLHLQRGKAPS
jgi:hypothetical protein